MGKSFRINMTAVSEILMEIFTDALSTISDVWLYIYRKKVHLGADIQTIKDNGIGINIPFFHTNILRHCLYTVSFNIKTEII